MRQAVFLISAVLTHSYPSMSGVIF